MTVFSLGRCDLGGGSVQQAARRATLPVREGVVVPCPAAKTMTSRGAASGPADQAREGGMATRENTPEIAMPDDAAEPPD